MAQATCGGALIQCSMGSAPCSLSVLPTSQVLSGGAPQGTISDGAPMMNVPSFGMCNSPSNPQVIAATSSAGGVFTPQPCVPVPTGPWIVGAPTVLVGGQPALNDTSTLMCAWAGVIQINMAGQFTVTTP